MKGKTLLLSLFKTKKMSGKAKALTAFTALFLGGFFVVHTLLAAVTVTPATGGTNISIDTTSAAGGTGAWTTLGSISGPMISESQVGQISAGTHTLTLPAGWEFKTTPTPQNVTIGISGGSNLSLASNIIIPSSNSLSFTVNSVSTNNPATLNFSDIQVRPTGTVVGTGNMTHSGAFISDVTDGVTNFGTFSTVAGAVNKLAVTTQPTDITYGSNVSNVVVKTQDQFGNDSVSGLAANSNVTVNLQTGSGALSGTMVQDIGTASGNGAVTYNDLYINDVGAKVLRATTSGLTNNTIDANSFTINQKALTATITANNKVYDGNNTAVIATRTPVGVVGADVVTVNGGTATFNNKNVGVAKVVTATGMTLGGADNAKYSFDGTGNGTADITTLAVTITATAAQTKVYGNADPVFAYTLSTPLVGGDNATGALSRVAGNNVGSYAITIGTLDLGANYATSFASNNFSITARPLTITGAANTKVYDQTTSSATNPTITSGSLAYTDTAGFTQVYGGPNVNINKNMIPSGIVNDGNGGANYTYTFVTNPVGVVTPKGLDVTGLSASSKVYNQSTNATITGPAALSGIIAPDVVTLSGVAVGNHNTPNVGATTVSVTGLSLTGAQATNYFINPIVLNSSITAYPVTVTATPAQTKVYGDADPVFAYTSTGLLVGNNFSGTLARDAGENVGNYNITQGTLNAGTNYAITFNSNTFAITPKPITVTANAAQTKVYGQADPTFTYTPSPALVGADTFSGALSRVAGENVGAYAMTQNTLSAGANYTITFVPDNFTITAKPITITPTAGQSKIYGDADPIFTYTPSPILIPGDSFSGALSRMPGANAGTYAYTMGTLSAGANYNLTLAPEVFTINKATPIITWANPADIAAGTPLSSTQLNAMANVPGVFTYTPTFGYAYTLVGAKTLSVDFAPTDSLNYNSVLNTQATLNIVPAIIDSLDIDASPVSLMVGLPSTITVKGYDAYGNLVTNNSTTRVFVHADGHANLNSASHLLVNGQWNFTLNSLVAGTSLVDTFSGSLTPDEIVVTFLGDTTAPTITMNGTPVQGITKTSANIVFQSNENGQAKVHYGLTTSYGNVTNYQSVTANTDKSIALTGLTCGTTYNYVVYAKDNSGNETIGTNDTFTTSACTVPIIPTVSVTGSAILPQYSQSDANARFASGVQFDLTNNASVTVNGSAVTNAATITAATNAEAKTIGVHSYDVIAMSSTGHTASLNISFEVIADADVILPVVTINPMSAPTQGSAAIAFSSTEAGQAKVHYGTTDAYGSVTTYQNITSGLETIILAGLTCGTDYHYMVYAKDAAGNEGMSSDQTFTTAACSDDVQSPSLSAVSSIAAENTSVINFTSDEIGSAKVLYGLSSSYGNVTGYAAMAVGSNSITVTGLTCGTTYHYDVSAMDNSNNETDSGDMTFTTSACPAAPVITHVNPSDVNADVDTADITFSSDKDGSAKVLYGLSGSYSNATAYESIAAGPSGKTITLTGLSCGITYHYSIYVKDALGNESNTADNWFTTDDCGVGDITDPTVIAQTPVDGSTGELLSINPTVEFSELMDAATINASTVQLRRYSDDSLVNAIVTLNTSSTIATIAPVDPLSANSQYYVYVTGAKDLAGNDVELYTTKADQEFSTVAAPTGSFGIISSIMTKMTGIADNTYAHGWEWLIRMTLPTDQNNFALKFNDWVSGSNTLSAGGNMEYYSDQITSGTGSAAAPVAITTANVYPANVAVTNDADANMDGIQTDVHVRIKLPASTPSGSYSTSYRVNYGM